MFDFWDDTGPTVIQTAYLHCTHMLPTRSACFTLTICSFWNILQVPGCCSQNGKKLSVEHWTLSVYHLVDAAVICVFSVKKKAAVLFRCEWQHSLKLPNQRKFGSFCLEFTVDKKSNFGKTAEIESLLLSLPVRVQWRTLEQPSFTHCACKYILDLIL